MFWDKLIELCAKKGVTVGQCMRDIGLTPASATGWKKGAMPIEVNIRKLAEYFDVSAEDLTNTDKPLSAEILAAEFLTLLKSQQNMLEKQTDTIATQSGTIASQNRIIEVMAVDKKKATRQTPAKRHHDERRGEN